MSVVAYNGPAEEFPSHSVFDDAVTAEQAARVIITDADGDHFGWQFTVEAAPQYGADNPDRVTYGGLKTPSAAKLTELEAHVSATAALTAKDELARTTIVNQVAAIKASGAPGTWSNADKRFMALVWILHRMD